VGTGKERVRGVFNIIPKGYQTIYDPYSSSLCIECGRKMYSLVCKSKSEMNEPRREREGEREIER